MNIEKKLIDTDPGSKATLTITSPVDMTANHVLPYIASNSVGIDITGGCEYCKAGKGIMNHYGIDFYAFARIENGQFEMAYSNNIMGDGLVTGHQGVKINYCPICGGRLEENEEV
jgi:hypothetical protein